MVYKMLRINTTLVYLCLLCTSFTTFSHANANRTPQVTLDEVLVDITKTDPQILEAIKQYESVVAERKIAFSEYLPTIGTELSGGPEWIDDETSSNSSEEFLTAQATLYARQNLFNGFKTSAYVDEVDARIQAAAHEVLNVANDVYLNAAEAYINVVKASELLQIAEENSLTQEKIMRQVREKTDAGFNRVSELYNSESRLALAKGSFLSRQQDLNQALVKFHRQLGRALTADQFVLPKPAYSLPDNLPDAVDTAFKKHPAIKVAKFNIDTRRHTVEKAKGDYYPSLDLELRGDYSHDTGGEEGEKYQTGAYLTLNYVFFDGGLRKGQKIRDEQQLRKEHQRSYIERRNLNEAVRLAWNIMDAEQAKYQFLNQHVTLSLKTLDAFKEEYYVGRRTLLDLLNMENEYTDAQLSLADSNFSKLTALYRIMQATGELLEVHDTGLRASLKLPEDGINDLLEYEESDSNRDQDAQVDISDQCDNSLAGTTEAVYGCEKQKVTQLGYPHADDKELPPYIIPDTEPEN